MRLFDWERVSWRDGGPEPVLRLERDGLYAELPVAADSRTEDGIESILGRLRAQLDESWEMLENAWKLRESGKGLGEIALTLGCRVPDLAPLAGVQLVHDEAHASFWRRVDALAAGRLTRPWTTRGEWAEGVHHPLCSRLEADVEKCGCWERSEG